jgi:hypothetical protein
VSCHDILETGDSASNNGSYEMYLVKIMVEIQIPLINYYWVASCLFYMLLIMYFNSLLSNSPHEMISFAVFS